MTEKILVVGDIHLGVNKNNPTFFKTALDFAAWVVQICKENQIKKVVQLGDIFHNREMIHQPALSCANEFFNILQDLKLDIIVGNHDCLHNETSEVNSLKLLNKWPNITIHEKVNTIDGITFCGWGSKMEDIPAKQRIIFGHFDIKGFCMSGSKLSEHGFTASDLMAKCDLLMTGHYHGYQTRKYGNSRLIYTGSAYQLNWGESGDDKYVFILDTETLKVSPLKNRISPRFEYIRGMDDFSKADNNFVSVEIENPEDFLRTVSMFKTLGAKDVRTTYKEVTLKSADTPEAETVTTGSSNIEEAVDEYTSLIPGIDDNVKLIVANQLKLFYNQCL